MRNERIAELKRKQDRELKRTQKRTEGTEKETFFYIPEWRNIEKRKKEKMSDV